MSETPSPIGADVSRSATAEADSTWILDLVDGLDAIVWELDLVSWLFTFVNTAAEDILGYPAERWLNELGFWEDTVLHPEDRDWALAFCENSTAAGKDHEFEYRAIAADGSIRWLRDHVKVVISDAGAPVRLRGVMLDVTADRQAEKRARELEHRFTCLADSISQGLVITDTDLNIVYANDRMEELTGYTTAELVGRHAPTFLLRDSDAVVGQMGDRLAGRSRTYEAEHILKDGTSVWFEVSGSPYRDLDGKIVGTIGLLRDIRERKEAEAALRSTEEQLREAQKMEAIGRFAGGVAHDFNNVLMTIRGSAEILLAETEADDPRAADYHSILEASDRAKSLTRQLVAFSRGQVLEQKVLDLTDTIRNLSLMLRRVIGVDVEFVVDIHPDLGLVRADSTQFEQVLMNLALNARDAMQGGGRLCIHARNHEVATAEAYYGTTVPAGRYVVVEVSDNGTGIPHTVREFIFEPFFTTKEAGKGSGLGLSTAYGIVKQLGGYIGVRSQVGKGTAFRIYLPRSEMAKTPVPEDSIQLTLPGGSDTVLLVDDEEAVRAITKRQLIKLGYSVVEATNGEEALRIFRADPSSVDVVLSDVMMPLMTGFQLAVALRESHRSLPLCLMSGFAHEAGTTSEYRAPFLQKPFTSEDLASKVRMALDGAGWHSS